MLKIIIKYFTTILLFVFLAIILLDYIILPSYVGYNNEKYLPDVRNEYREKAVYILRELGFNSEIILIPYSKDNIPGTVIKMFPRPFTKVKIGGNINLTIAGKDQDIIIPDLIKMTLRNAKLTISKLGLGIDTIIYEFDNNIKDGRITFHLPKDNQTVKSSSNMILGISKGPPPDYYIVPNILNFSLNKAEEQIIQSGLRIGEIYYEYQPDLIPNTVLEQSMTSGMRVSFPASINLTISKINKE